MKFLSWKTFTRLRDAGFPVGETLHMPGPAEILYELGPEYTIGVQGAYFWCGRVGDNSAKFDKNMAEACAAAWLSIHEKNQ